MNNISSTNCTVNININNTETRLCPKCNNYKNVNEFYKNTILLQNMFCTN